MTPQISAINQNEVDEASKPQTEIKLTPSNEANKVLEKRFLSMDVGEALELFSRVYNFGLEITGSGTFKRRNLNYKRKIDITQNKARTVQSLPEGQVMSTISGYDGQPEEEDFSFTSEEISNMESPSSRYEMQGDITDEIKQLHEELNIQEQRIAEIHKELDEKINSVKTVTKLLAINMGDKPVEVNQSMRWILLLVICVIILIVFLSLKQSGILP
jgi:hypothetical protein